MSVKNILYWYEQSNEAERDFDWYSDALEQCRKIALHYDMPVYRVVSVVAALSPNNKWERNVSNAYDLIGAYLRGDHMETVKVSTYNKMKEKAWFLLEDRPTYDETKVILSGQKITCFFENIMGEDTCTIDGHARNIFYNERVGLTNDKTNIGTKEYRLLQAAYVHAAKKVGIKAYEMQAITWMAWRRHHGIS